ncbi:trk system potassium uptake protein TrkA [Orenia metallireducens]|uniref:Trk system potassium uptake protein TrkA n=1 Tax=Orenia metallireducens TaxID=1413210 RepID=A0A285GX42_9FIRM|nr:TrkA family potassium uptake protein [Orenia metallireducens]PRX25286.1 trk system potassium uptake protein TrkA [Orenia metallireducens]SNY27116.1 trk system potassium uptake protein TrkA [Orenia metallireducens]
MRQFIVVGLGRFGYSVAKTLADKHYDVLAIDTDEEKIQEISSIVTHAVQADATDEEALKTLGASNFDVAVVSIGENIHANILATLILKELGVKSVVVKAKDQLHGKVLGKVGADRIVYPERDMGMRIANNLISSNVLEYIELAPNYSVVEIAADENMYNKNLLDLQLRSRFGVNVMAIKSQDGIDISPRAESKIKAGDTLIVMGDNDSLDELRKM